MKNYHQSPKFKLLGNSQFNCLIIILKRSKYAVCSSQLETWDLTSHHLGEVSGENNMIKMIVS